mgnify:CR=1 FL=1
MIQVMKGIQRVNNSTVHEGEMSQKKKFKFGRRNPFNLCQRNIECRHLLQSSVYRGKMENIYLR